MAASGFSLEFKIHEELTHKAILGASLFIINICRDGVVALQLMRNSNAW